MSTACSSSPCLHDGTCILDSSHTYRCACLGGYTGKNCEHGEFQTGSNGRIQIICYLWGFEVSFQGSCTQVALWVTLWVSHFVQKPKTSSHNEPLPRRIIVPLMHHKSTWTCSHEVDECGFLIGLEAAEACCLLFQAASFWSVSLSRLANDRRVSSCQRLEDTMKMKQDDRNCT